MPKVTVVGKAEKLPGHSPGELDWGSYAQVVYAPGHPEHIGDVCLIDDQAHAHCLDGGGFYFDEGNHDDYRFEKLDIEEIKLTLK